MKKFTQIFEGSMNGPYNRKTVQEFLKAHDEIDVITKIGQRLFIPAYMHNNGKLEDADDRTLTALLLDGTKVKVYYSDIKKITW